MSIKLEAVTKSYGALKAVDEVSLQVPSHKTLVLIGPSGCGKSTILRLMNGLIQPDTGRIYFDGELLKRENVLGLRHKTGYVIQEGGLFPHLTISQNLGILLRHLGWKQTEIEERTEALFELTHLNLDLLPRYPSELSGGQRQRISLIRALMHNPDYLLMDEPLGAVDPMIRAELQRELKSIFQSLKKTVIIVTHDLHEARYLGDVIALMNCGRIVQLGSYQKLRDEPKEEFVTDFIHAQQMPQA